MNNEADFKKVFCDSVAKQGGYTFKIAMSSVSGLPDIYCAMPGFVPVLLEAKWMKNLPLGKFKRKIPYRPLQREILSNCNRVYADRFDYVAWGLIGMEIDEQKYCTLLKPGVEIITEKELINSLTIIKGEDIQIYPLFDLRVPRMYNE